MKIQLEVDEYRFPFRLTSEFLGDGINYIEEGNYLELRADGYAKDEGGIELYNGDRVLFIPWSLITGLLVTQRRDLESYEEEKIGITMDEIAERRQAMRRRGERQGA